MGAALKNWRFLLPSIVFTIFLDHSYASTTITFHRVGEGNCTTIAVNRESKSNTTKEYMIVDCGTSEFKRTFDTPIDLSRPFHPIEPSSDRLSFRASEPSAGVEHQGEEIDKEQALQGIRQALGQKIHEGISVKTVVISHPDSDHFNWIMDVVDPDNHHDTLENIVLGGRPEKYLRHVGFYTWLQKWLNRRPKPTNVFFLAVDGFKVSLENLDTLKKGKYDLAPSLLSNPQIKQFNLVVAREPEVKLYLPSQNLAEAFNFGKGVLFQFLTVNPLHTPSNIPYNQYIRLFYSEEEAGDIDNPDSLVMKIITATGQSAVILGDATALTMRKVFSNYYHNELKTDVLLAAHHGANSWGSNNYDLFDTLRPNYIIFSNGQHLKFNHPRKTAYDNAKNHAFITNSHRITLYGKHEATDRDNQYLKYETQRAIFSTFDNGSIRINFSDNGAINVRSFSYLEEELEEELGKEKEKEKEEEEKEYAPLKVEEKEQKIGEKFLGTVQTLSPNAPIYASPFPDRIKKEEKFIAPSFQMPTESSNKLRNEEGIQQFLLHLRAHYLSDEKIIEVKLRNDPSYSSYKDVITRIRKGQPVRLNQAQVNAIAALLTRQFRSELDKWIPSGSSKN